VVRRASAPRACGRRGESHAGVAASSAMKGTSGTADLELLRGRTGDAALGPGGVRVSDAFVPRYSRAGRETMRERVRRVRLRKRVAEGPRASYPSRGWGSCGGIVRGVSLHPSPDGEIPPRRRSLQPAVQRSHDERCPSGSSRGKSSLSTPVRACEREGDGGGASRRCPLARETSTSTVHGFGRGFGSDRTTRRRCPYRTQGFRSLLTRHGAQASTRPCSRIVRLQKSTSGAWSRLEGPGLARRSSRASVRTRRANPRRTPVRGGESHEHASSETGDGSS